MATGKKSVIIYIDLIHVIEKLTDQQAGQYFKHFLRYVNDLNPIAPDNLIDLIFEPQKQQLKRDLKDWEKTREKRSESGRLGGLKSGETRKQNEANEASASNSKQKQANEAVTVNVNDTVNVTDTVKEIREKSTRFIPPTLEEIISYCSERKNDVDAYKWLNFYTAKNWMIGKNKMKDWQAAVRTWENNNKNKSNVRTEKNNGNTEDFDNGFFNHLKK